MPTRIFAQNEPLTKAEFDRLGEFLNRCRGGKAMNIEELDGFFAALVAGPDMVMPSEYLPEVFSGEMSDTCEFADFDEANDILGLLMRHWNAISATLHKDEVYPMMLLEDENGVAYGNDWARGFMRGVAMRHEGWAEFLADKEEGGWMLPALALYHEHDEDPEMRPEPISPERREDIIVHMAAGLLAAYRYFRQRRAYAGTYVPEPRRNAPKVGRNDPCPCGSGRKYKKCCGGAAVN